MRDIGREIHTCFKSWSHLQTSDQRVSSVQMVQYSNNVSSANSRGGGSLLCMNNFLDTTNIEGRFDYSEWVRAYGNYIDEQLEIYRELNFYPVSFLKPQVSFGILALYMSWQWQGRLMRHFWQLP